MVAAMKVGRTHSLVKQLRALRRDGALRRSEGRIVAEGIHLVEEALAAGAHIEALVFDRRLEEHPRGEALQAAAAAQEIPAHEVTPRLMESLQDARSPQPVLALVRWNAPDVDRLLAALPPEPLVVVAHSIQDPGNLGALLRSADAAGADAFVACGACADLAHPRAVRASKGSLFRLAAGRDDADAVAQRLRDRGLRTVGSAPGAPLPYHESDLRGPLALFLGSEADGLPAALMDALDTTVSIPMRDGVQSLSVGAAAAVLLFEAARQRS